MNGVIVARRRNILIEDAIRVRVGNDDDLLRGRSIESKLKVTGGIRSIACQNGAEVEGSSLLCRGDRVQRDGDARKRCLAQVLNAVAVDVIEESPRHEMLVVGRHIGNRSSAGGNSSSGASAKDPLCNGPFRGQRDSLAFRAAKRGRRRGA